MFVITGGGKGLGRALAKALANQNQQVIVIGRDKPALQELVENHSNMAYICADVGQIEGRAAIQAFISQLNILSLKGLIHNAGLIEPIASMTKLKQEEWHRCIVTNLEAPFFLTQLLSPYLNQAKVLHIGSGAAHFPIHGWSAYCVSKAALAMLTRCWQLEQPGFAVASVMPGIIDTAMQDRIRQSNAMDAAKLEFFCELKANQRLLTPETVASFLVWLLLDTSLEIFASQEWDIYDVTHHHQWLRAPYHVPAID